jgi:prepilin-type N-terminal cleavage/methylation domain-containing protein
MRDSRRPSRCALAGSGRNRRGFTLLESLYAAAILSIMSLATIQGVTAGQQQAVAAQNQLLAVLVADSTMNELAVTPYGELPLWDADVDAVGALEALDGTAYPATAATLGRGITVASDTVAFDDPPVKIQGYTVTVSVFDAKRVLVEVSRFFPEPAQ